MGNAETAQAIAIVGAGPRGASIIERIAAYLNRSPDGADLTIHVIDDAQPGAGRVWATDQTRTLCMNTLAGAVTLFTEPGATVEAPVFEGPILYEWIRLLRGEREGIAPAKAAVFDEFSPEDSVMRGFAEEIAATRPESNPSRALYGAYIHWFYRVAAAQLPDWVTVVEHRSRVVALEARGPRDALRFADGTEVMADATVLATGWTPNGPSRQEEALAASGLTWIRPDNPLDQPVDALPEGGPVLVRGLGMGFFDLMALLTIDRGGLFVEDAGARSGLRYEPSGREPHLVVTSGRGYPYLPKSEYKSLPPAANLERLSKACAALGGTPAGSRAIDFGVEVWPAIVRDAYSEYYRTQARVAPGTLRLPLPEVLALIDGADLEGAASAEEAFGAVRALGAALDGVSEEPFDLAYWMDPLAGFAGSVGELTALIGEGMARDIREAVAAWDSPVKAGLWAVSAARKPSSILGSEGRFTRASRDGAYAQFVATGQMAGSGPPLFRIRQLLALTDSGLVTFLGPRPALSIGEEFTVTSGGRSASSGALVDAWMHAPDITNPEARGLYDSLIQAGRVRPFRDGRASASPEVDPATRRAVGGAGEPDVRLHIVGIPTHAQLPDTTISPMPGTDPLMLQETDTAARSLLRTVGVL